MEKLGSSGKNYRFTGDIDRIEDIPHRWIWPDWGLKS